MAGITLKGDNRNIIILILLIIILLLGYFTFNQIGKVKQTKLDADNLNRALTDSLHTHKNKNGELVNEKLTIQATTKELESKNAHLTDLQKELVSKVNEVNKQNQIIAAALVKMDVRLDGLTNSKPVAQTDSTVSFAQKNDSIDYEVLVSNVKALENKIPSLKFNKFSLPNKQTISFQWKDNRKEGYPVSFTVSNSNPYFHVTNVESFIIPEIKKETLKPNLWQKLGKLSKSTGGKLVFFGAGILVGGALLNN